MTTASVRKPEVSVSEKRSLSAALSAASGEKAPRDFVRKEGRNLTYADLEKMTVKELLSCDIQLDGVRLEFKDNKKLMEGTCYISWSDGSNHTYFNSFGAQEPANKALDIMYSLPLSLRKEV